MTSFIGITDNNFSAVATTTETSQNGASLSFNLILFKKEL